MRCNKEIVQKLRLSITSKYMKNNLLDVEGG